ncbi:MAG: hypothetical protein JHD16_00150 [Solirubrobacteraceae bacterium]|nr:hypothetical protein [Solirubrobacteraceae bacterium]
MSRRNQRRRPSIARAAASLAPDQLAGLQRHAANHDSRSLRTRLDRIERRTRAVGLHRQADAARALRKTPSDRAIAALLALADQNGGGRQFPITTTSSETGNDRA